MFEMLVALMLADAPVSNYPGATFFLPDGTEVLSPALPPPDYRGMTAEVVVFVDTPYIDPFCGGKPGDDIIACTFSDTDNDHMVLPNPCEARWHNDTYAVIVCHEKGHVLGWQHD